MATELNKQPVSEPDFSVVVSDCKEYMQQVEDPERTPDDDMIEYIFEAAMKAVFGDDVFKYINERLK